MPSTGHEGAASLRQSRIRWAAGTIAAFVLPVVVDPIRSAITGDERMPDLAWDVGRTFGMAFLVVWIVVEIVRWARRVFRSAPGAAMTIRDPQMVRRILADHDLPCPRCAYNLRGVERDRCPECGGVLVIGVGAIDPWQRVLPFLMIVGWMMVSAGVLRALTLGRSVSMNWTQLPGMGFAQPAWWGGWPWHTRWLVDILLSLLPAAVVLPLMVRVMVAGPETSNRRAYRLMQGIVVVLLVLVLWPWAGDRFFP